jgi:hypothetical protein
MTFEQAAGAHGAVVSTPVSLEYPEPSGNKEPTEPPASSPESAAEQG